MGKRLLAALFAGAMLAIAAASVHAQTYPSRPISIVVPFMPGGGVDLYGRTVGQKLQERLGQPIIVENKAGAGGNIGAEFVAKSLPDGYALLVMTNAIVTVPWVSKLLPFNVLKDFAPMGPL